MTIFDIDKRKVNSYISLIPKKRNKLALAYNMLKELNFDELEYMYGRTPHVFKGLVTLSFLYRSGYDNICSSGYNIRLDFLKFFGVATYLCRSNSEKINRFLSYKKDVDNYMLLGKYNKALALIKKINEKISYSYWAGEYEIKITRLLNGINAATNLYNALFFKSNPIIRFYYQTALQTSSLEIIGDRLESSALGELKYDDFLRNIIYSHCFPNEEYTEGDWCCIDFNSSIIDFYLNTVNYLSHLNKETYENETFLYLLNRFCEKVDDDHLCKIWSLSNNSSETKSDHLQAELIKAYIKGNYGFVVEQAPAYLQSVPEDMEMVNRYLRSCVFSNQEPKNMNDKGSILERIIFHLYHYLMKDNESANLRKLKVICKSQCQILGLRQLYIILQCYEADGMYDNDINRWRYSQNSIYESSFFNSTEKKKEYIASSNLFNNITDIFSTSAHKIGNDCFEIVIAKQNGDYIYEQLMQNFTQNHLPVFMENSVSSELFAWLLRKDKLKEAITFYVEARLNHDQINIKVDKNFLESVLTEEVDNQMGMPLELSIFYYLVNFETIKVYLCFKKYLRECKVRKASELVIDGTKKQKFFLSNVANIKVMSLHVIQFDSLEKVMDERIAICRKLYDYYHEKRYTEENAEINRDKQISKLNHKVNESKIYVDISSIIEHEMDYVNSLYDSYFSTENDARFYEEGRFQSIIESLKKIEGVKEVAVIGDGIAERKQEINIKKDILTRIFVAIRNQFLFNPKYGLDNYLSTRIRHGTLVNQLRNHFEENKLITNTQNGIYVKNLYWAKEIFGLTSNVFNAVVDSFNVFSKEIDDTINSLKNDYIQVVTEEQNDKEKGCFNFNIEAFRLSIDDIMLDENIQTQERCTKEIFKCLWKHTEDCLSVVKQVLAQRQSVMLDKLRDLTKEITQIVGKNHPKIYKFTDACSHCQNDIQTDFNTVLQWFNINSEENFEFTLSQVLDTCIEFVNSNRQHKLSTNIDNKITYEFKGEYFGALYDMFFDILANAASYEAKAGMHGKCSIFVTEESGFMHIIVKNPIRKEDEAELADVINKINADLSQKVKSGKTRGEGHSGCSKIYNAVHYHLGSDENEYSNRLEDSHFVVEIHLELKPILM